MPAIRIADFDTWRPGYGLAEVRVLRAGTNLLADIFSDEALTQSAANPQTLQERIVDNTSYGKFTAARYVGEPYELEINSVDRTGISRPSLTSLAGENASDALVTVSGGSRALPLDDRLARAVFVDDFGLFNKVGDVGASASTNNATLVAAIGAAGARGGGFVDLPSGTFQVTTFSIPQGVILRGVGRAATILQSAQAGIVATIGGARAGLCRLTLDGVTLVGNSIGVYAENKDEIVLHDCEIKRFETGVYRKGGALCAWVDLFIQQCVNGYKAYGEDAGGAGGVLRFNSWRGGKIDLCTTAAIDLQNKDLACTHNQFINLGLESNTGTAVKIVGARSTSFIDAWFEDNTVNLNVTDGTPETTLNTVVGLEFLGGSMQDGTIVLGGNVEAVAFRRMTFQDVAVTITTPRNNILVQDCREVSGVTITGAATAWLRSKSFDRGSASGVTTGNAATKAWGMPLRPGQKVYLEAKVIGRQRNGVNVGFYHLAIAAERPGASLAYEAQTGNFTVGNVVTGQTSGATARITADTDGGATGTLTVQDVTGTFVDNEIITDGAGGSATVNGSITSPNVRIKTSATLAYDGQSSNFTNGDTITGATSGATAKLVTQTDAGTTGTLTLNDIHGAFVDNDVLSNGASGNGAADGLLNFSANQVTPFIETNANWHCAFVANVGEIELRVTGDTSQTVEWVGDVNVVSS